MNNAAEIPHSIDCRWLLALYALIPLCLVLVLIDSLLLDGLALHQYLPDNPDNWPLWTLIFGLPHIIASLITMADRDYLAHYRRTLFWPMLAFAALASAGYLGPQPLSYNLLFVFFAFYTIYHVLAQQLGLTLMMMGIAPNGNFKAWKWVSVFAGFAIYINVYGSQYLGQINLGPISLYQLMTWVAALLCAAQLTLAIRLTPQSRSRIGVWYLWGNVALLLSALLINEIGYTLFVILIPRIIHDVTAYMVYITHDRNRNKSQPVNLVYRATAFSRLSPVLLLPLFSILIALALTSHQQYPLVSIVILTLSFLHYYFEGFIWRGPNPHRQFIQFKR
ncbi:MAG: hypothetical protein CVV16_04680 [Gammaproteobacteria bacterium HGW-Gammaproteobacteria-6]|nr:MAG: hypothetical protein CVV16_04680 [Gammaproteobacteria bacterium HGW-Gammaproteobacteria-6]